MLCEIERWGSTMLNTVLVAELTWESPQIVRFITGMNYEDPSSDTENSQSDNSIKNSKTKREYNKL